ncbi:serine/threonine-protein kinase [Nocardioides dokdonensis]|uniref:serine/threonine-protein kinase n=1 Tax=Nocardioides dokdonensis TaxID=450734 RepID=UPI001471D9F3|nr:serine/threonine-protein kinase [Nocardioides dokdonensis]
MYAAETLSGDRVVIKTVLSEHADNADFRRRFRREVVAASAVESPFLAKILASDVDDRRQWLAMEHVPGPTLDELVRQHGPMTPAQQVDLAIGLAAGLNELHAAGLIHRDLKPSNVICTDGGPRIVDFGIAVLSGLPTFTATGVLSPGTPGWMAPEQSDPSVRPSQAVDLYAWGCLCFFAAVGTSPRQLEAEPSTERATWSREMTTPAMPDSMPVVLRGAVQRALCAEPSARGSAAQYLAMMRPLVTALNEEETQAMPVAAAVGASSTMLSTKVDPAPDPPREQRRQRGTFLVYVTAAIAVLALAGALIATVSIRKDEVGSASVSRDFGSGSTASPTNEPLSRTKAPQRPATSGTAESPKPPAARAGYLPIGRTVRLEYFDVAVRAQRTTRTTWSVDVKVCYARPHDSANPDGTTRVSTDPWAMDYLSTRRQTERTSISELTVLRGPAPLYTEARLSLGDCRSGWITVGRPRGSRGLLGMHYAPADFPSSAATWRWAM